MVKDESTNTLSQAALSSMQSLICFKVLEERSDSKEKMIMIGNNFLLSACN